MSDTMEDLSKKFEEEVLFDLSSSNTGPYLTPEYPSLTLEPGMWSSALDVILTTLRYLAPATLLTLFWGQQSFLFKLLKHVDKAFRAIVYSSEEQKKEVLKWVSEAGCVRIEHLDTIWRHGWTVCAVLDAALPGACAGHPPTRLSLRHAQAIADHYLGIEPVFSRQELESSDSLSRNQEWKLATYLNRIRQALSKLTPPVSKPASLRTSPDTVQFTKDYIARGSGLTTAQINNKMKFKIYPTAQQCLDPGEIAVLIKGPKDTYGMTMIPPILGKAQLIRQKLLGLQVTPSYTENVLPITQGATYLRNFGKNKMSKTYFIPKVNYEIEIEFESCEDHARVSYTAKMEGRYEISITSRGHNILGSPFQVTASHNKLTMIEKESFCLEDGEEIDIVDVPTDRKVVLRIVDFVTEKMLLREDGALEKISEEEAQKLMNTDKETLRKYSEKFSAEEFALIEKTFITQQKKFKYMANKVKTLCKICKVFNNFIVAGNVNTKENLNYVRPKSPQDIPDIVNSTFSDSNKNIFVKETRSKFIVPEPISVCIRNEVKDKEKQSFQLENIHLSETDAALKQIMNDAAEHTASGNPFVDVEFESSYTTQNGVFVTSEYEADYSQNEEEPETPIKIVVHQDSASPEDNNKSYMPEDYINMERPKTPILKIITGDVKNREDSLYVDPIIAKTLDEDILGNEFINPFFMHQHTQSTQEAQTPITDFLIGAPVSLPPILRAPTPEPKMDSMTMSENGQLKQLGKDDSSSSVFSTPLPTYLNKKDISVSSTFHSLDSDFSQDFHLHNEGNILHLTEPNKNVTHKDIWDSAYVSIDDITSSPDSNNNDNISSRESPIKSSFPPSKTGLTIKKEELLKMGPAEKEIWQSCNELKNVTETQVDIPTKVYDKRLLFTPIIEENISVALTPTRKSEIDSVTMAFGEISNIYNKYYPLSDSNSCNNSTDDSTGDKSDVDSASETKADVKRQPKKFLEGEISEIQPQVTESISVSRTLHSPESSGIEYKDKQSNLVLEKKLYWDKRIKEIEAKAAENNAQQKRRKLSAKYLRNDSLTKRRGKQIAKTILNKDIQKPINRSSEIIKLADISSEEKKESVDCYKNDKTNDEKLVEKWKKYWDSKLETEKDLETNSVKSGSLKMPNSIDDKGHFETTSSILPVKQELPEEVFKAFETSPKRFFGTSRKQILNKIDIFLGKESTANDSLPEVSISSKETGLVSSRISLFHNISHTEEVPWSPGKKSNSMHDIYQRKSNDSTAVVKLQNSQPTTPEPPKTIEKTKEILTLISNTQTYPSIKEKRAKFGQSKILSKTFDDHQRDQHDSPVNKPYKHQDFNIATNVNRFYPAVLRKTSLSKSEMDIFTKRTNTVRTSDYLDRYQSCDDLPKVNVKNFISLYETVSKCSIESKMPRKMSCSSLGSQKNLPETTRSLPATSLPISRDYSESPKTEEVMTPPPSTTPSLDCDLKQDNDSGIQNTTNTDDDGHSYISLSDVDIEIIENSSPEKSTESSPERETETAHIEYKSRFKMAKQFFKSLEEIKDEKRPKKLNECEKMLYSKSTDESPETRPNRVKNYIKSKTVPTSESSKAWEQLHSSQHENKLVKISEKFNVEDLFSDVVEGKLSRQGSLRGIPHKQAVLATFKSMDNLTDKNINAYEIVISQLKDFSKENRIQNAQTYLSEYPYLPTTDPTKYHSRMDAKASGLISLKEILNQKKIERQNKPRRNSVPDIRLNPNFTVQL